MKALEEARAKLAALPGTATEEEKKAAEAAVKAAETTAATAATAKETADKKLIDARDALADMHIEASQVYSRLTKAVEEAAADLAAAEKALEDAKKDEDGKGDEDDDGMCAEDDRLVAELTGLPAKVAAGSTVDLTVRVTNNTGKTVDRAYGQVALAPAGGALVTLFTPRFSTGPSTTWRPWNSKGIAVNVGELEPGAHADLRLRLSPAASIRDWSGRIEVSGWYERGDDCGANTTLKRHAFQVVAALATTPPPNTPAPRAAPEPRRCPARPPRHPRRPRRPRRPGPSPTPVRPTPWAAWPSRAAPPWRSAPARCSSRAAAERTAPEAGRPRPGA